jgi:adenosylcobinamide-phosphate synthase
MLVLTAVICAGFIADCFFGDPHFMPHPVRVMGFIIAKGDKILRKNNNILNLVSGAFLSIFLIALTYAASFSALYFLYKINYILGAAVEIFLCYQIFAAKALKDESMKVYYELQKKDIIKSRLYLSYIVGRDTENLNEEQISKAAVETVAENLSDGVIAPMIYMLIGGAPLGLAYKAVNTLDSMIGYKNDKYMFFGKFAARLDDVVNFIPSRISALSMIAAAFICRMNYKRAVKVFLRDRYKHKSPNSAQTESVCAGALETVLSGSNYYGGVLVEKPVIGVLDGEDMNNLRKTDKEDIKTANKLMYAASCVALLAGICVRLSLYFLLF